MTVSCAINGIAVARAVTAELGERLGVPLPRAARPGADLLVRAERGRPFPPPGRLLRARDGWVHPGPPTAWPAFTAMARTLGARPAGGADGLPDLGDLEAEVVDGEAGAWRLPAVAVRTTASAPARVPVPVAATPGLGGATVLVLGSAWAAPLAGLVLARLGARVVRVDHPRRPDPFPLARELAAGQARRPTDLDAPGGRDQFASVLATADVLVDATTPRVLANAGFDAATRRSLRPHLVTVQLAAFADDDRPGYGLAAECRSGWAARHEPPRLARTSVADPIAGLLVALTVVDALLGTGARDARVSLEGAAGLLLDRARRG